jgi:hypothetical protein
VCRASRTIQEQMPCELDRGESAKERAVAADGCFEDGRGSVSNSLVGRAILDVLSDCSAERQRALGPRQAARLHNRGARRLCR